MTLYTLAIAPVLIILFYVWLRDKYEREPFKLLLLSLLAGIIIVFPVILFERLLDSLNPAGSQVGNAAYEAFMVAALVEESFKFLALYLLFWRNKNLNEKFDGIVYAVFISLGFAGVENVMYVTQLGMNTALTRALTAVPAHALMGISMGYFFGIAHMYAELKKANLRKAFLVPFLLHGIYDFILMAQLDWLLLLFIPYMVYLYFTGFRKMKVTSDSSIFRDNVKLPD